MQCNSERERDREREIYIYNPEVLSSFGSGTLKAHFSPSL
jgi:hypothetical protein